MFKIAKKLDAAFGLLNIPDVAPIRIIKNISMCRDCHNFMKVISSLNARVSSFEIASSSINLSMGSFMWGLC